MSRSLLTRLALSTSLALLLAGCEAGEAPEAETPADDVATRAEAPVGLDLPDGAETAADEITAEYMTGLVQELSDDALAGRLPGTEGDRMAQDRIAAEMQNLGLEPGGTDGYFQPFSLVGVASTMPETWTFSPADGDDVVLDRGDEFIAASGVQTETASIDGAEVVFVGYGIDAPEYGWDDYAGHDVEGKVLLMLNNDPDWDDELFAGERRLYYGRWTYKYEVAAEKGAAGAIIIHTEPSAGYGWQVVESSWTGEQFQLPAAGEPTTQVEAWVTHDAAQRLVAAAGQDLAELAERARSTDFEPVPLGVTTSLTLANAVQEGARTGNVAGLLRGSDPDLADEVVVYTAHHDHLGTGEPDDDGDTIYNGARDNASGVAQILAAARAFLALPEPPRRSILFLAVGAEEQGLLGSAYYASNPTFPPGRIAANVNLDAGNIWGRTSDLIYIGYGKSSLDAIVDAAAARQDRTVVGDQFPDKGFFYRSDQFNFAKIGVPAVYLDGGTQFLDDAAGKLAEEWESLHYHQRSDEYVPEEWDLSGMVEDTRAAFFIGLAVAEADAMPSWNAGDEFEAARLEALVERSE